MSIPYPSEVDWKWLATDIVMPLVAWAFVILVVAIIIDLICWSVRRSREKYERQLEQREAEDARERHR